MVVILVVIIMMMMIIMIMIMIMIVIIIHMVILMMIVVVMTLIMDPSAAPEALLYMRMTQVSNSARSHETARLIGFLGYWGSPVASKPERPNFVLLLNRRCR